MSIDTVSKNSARFKQQGQTVSNHMKAIHDFMKASKNLRVTVIAKSVGHSDAKECN